MTNAVSIRNLKKSYNDTVALKGVDITINDGEFFGLLGPNGAGKTTTINILTGLVRKNEGDAKIFGQDTVKDYRFTRSQVGIAAQELTQDWFFPLERLLYFQAGYYGIPKQKAKKRVEELFDRLGLEEKRQARLRQLSGGMKRRFHKAGKTILLTTHYIEEAEMLCDKVAIIDKGSVIKVGTPKELTRQLGKAGITINVTGADTALDSYLNNFTYTREDGRLHFTTQDPEEALPDIINALTRQGCHIQRVETTKSSLEDVFLSLTGKGINE